MKILFFVLILLFTSKTLGAEPRPHTYPTIAFVVSERIDAPNQNSAGTVSIVEYNGEIKFLTNAHVVDNNGYFKYIKFKSGQIRNFTVEKINVKMDLALLRLDYPIKTKASPLSRKKPRRGQRVFAMGFGWNKYQEASGRILEIKHTPVSFLTDIPSISGTSGGPCIDENGYLLGIRNASGPWRNMDQTNVIDLETVKKFLED